MSLKPCPFCGRQADLSLPTCRPETPYDPLDRLYPLVRCANCFGSAYGENEDYKGTTAEAAWNLRTPTDSEET